MNADWQTGRQSMTQAGRDTGRQGHRQTETQAGKQAMTQAGRDTGKQGHRQASRQ